MPKSANLISQIKEVCQITRADWVVIIGRSDENWSIQIAQGLNRHDQLNLVKYLNTSEANAWVSGALLSGRGRWRKNSEKVFSFGSERLYLFPTQSTDTALIVGTDELDKNGQIFWRILASFINGPQIEIPQNAISEQTTPQKEKLFIGQYQDLSGLLDRLVEIIRQMLPCEALWIGIRHGDMTTLEKVWNVPDWLEKIDIQPEDTARIFSLCSPGYAIREVNSPDWFQLHRAIFSMPCRYWVGIPILQGQKPIGLISIFGSKRFLQKDLESLTRLALHVSPVLNSAVELVETNRQLACFNRLNGIALAVTQGENLEEVARQFIRLVADGIQTRLIGLLLPTTDRKYLHPYGAEPVVSEPGYAVQDTLVGHVFETGISVQISDARKEIVPYPITPGILSELIVPLIYRGIVTGVLAVESSKANAFHHDDVEFLTLVAGYMAGYLELLRLKQTTELRANNLSLIYNLIQKIGGLSDIQQITQLSAELLAGHFTESGVEIAVLENGEQSKTITAAAGNFNPESEGMLAKQEVSESLRLYSTNQMIEGDSGVARSYPWDNKQRFAHQILLPILQKTNLLGLINVTGPAKQKFSYHDILIVEVFAGVLSGHLPVALRIN
jgi:GAF domain-containing protein